MSLLSTENISVQLTPPVTRAVKKGHPWIFDRGILKQNKAAEPGDLAILYDQKRKFVGIGLFDPESPIKIRVLHRGQLDGGQPLGQRLLQRGDAVFQSLDSRFELLGVGVLAQHGTDDDGHN